MDAGISLAEGVLWVLAWFGVMLFYTFLDVAVWRKIAPKKARLLNVASIALCMAGFLCLLRSKSNYQIDLARENTFEGILLAAASAVLMYFLLDKFLDPVFEGLLPGIVIVKRSAACGKRRSSASLRSAYSRPSWEKF